MQLQHLDFPFALLTPCFSGTALGKLDDHAEMRIPPIRGHVRFWHRQLFGVGDANAVWGSTSGNEGRGSRVALHLTEGQVVGRHLAPLLPHDLRKSGKDRPSLRDGEPFTLRLQRLVGCTNDDWDHAQRAVRLWLLIGGLGLRSNRAAGSVWPAGDWVPEDVAALQRALQALGLTTWNVALVGLAAQRSPEDLRITASDTIAGNRHQQVFGGIQPQRTPSPLRFKVVRLGPDYGLLAVAPARQVLGTDRRPCRLIEAAEHLLRNEKPQPSRWEALGPWQPLLPCTR